MRCLPKVTQINEASRLTNQHYVDTHAFTLP
jgi:hypothetical protein